MRLLQRTSTGELSLTGELFGNSIPPYAILSHTWGPSAKEVKFKDITNGKGKGKAAYNKLRFCAERAASDGLRYFWVDTCCIDKSSSAELQEAITSMFQWYRNAAKCYVYLSDVPSPAIDLNSEVSQVPWESAFRDSKWFTRGWTLQELLAPESVEFFSREGNRIGDKKSLERQIHEITGIRLSALQGTSLSRFSVEERFSWIKNRQTTREEDMAYSLLGVFGIYMPLIYGEGGSNAFTRLRFEISRHSGDTRSYLRFSGPIRWLAGALSHIIVSVLTGIGVMKYSSEKPMECTGSQIPDSSPPSTKGSNSEVKDSDKAIEKHLEGDRSDKGNKEHDGQKENKDGEEDTAAQETAEKPVVSYGTWIWGLIVLKAPSEDDFDTDRNTEYSRSGTSTRYSPPPDDRYCYSFTGDYYESSVVANTIIR